MQAIVNRSVYAIMCLFSGRRGNRMMNVSVYMLPSALSNKDVAGKAVVVIDALRMTSVAITALANGASGLLAVGQVDEALSYRESMPGALLGGERNGLLIPGFDLDNSPLSYTAQRVGGKRVIMTTTNGTRAILAADAARRVLLGAYINASAVADALINEENVAILCAGTAQRFSMEDVVAGGSIISRLQERVETIHLDDAAQAALRLYRGARQNLKEALSTTHHYNVMRAGGQQADIDYCIREDALAVVPELKSDGFFRLV